MEQNGEYLNLSDINKLSDNEFKKHFLEWIEVDGVARTLQSKLRKDLFENFNRTILGRRLNARFQKSNRMVLSPLILALNTLVAEFLYAQNCHFTLSVFTTEVPYRSTLPDFEREETFRFSPEDLSEIFEAITMHESNEVAQEVSHQYINKLTKDNSSLLYCIFKNIFKLNKTYSLPSARTETVAKEKRKPSPPPSPPPDSGRQSTERSNSSQKSKDKRKLIDNKQFRYFKKYLVILSRKVKEIAMKVENIDQKYEAKEEEEHQHEKSKKIINLNKSLEKISENLKLLSSSKKKSKKISFLLTSIDKMAQQLENCASTFERISHNVQEQKEIPTEREKSYSDWIKEMKATKNGRKFLSRVDSILRKNLETEKEKLAKSYEEKFERERRLIKLKYKQRLLEYVKSHAANDDKGNDFNSNIEKKLQELNLMQQDLIDKITKPADVASAKTVGSNTKRSVEIQTEMKKINDEIPERETKQVSEKTISLDEMLQRCNQIKESFKPVEKIPQTIVEQEKHVDQIVFDAKMRIQELEYEGNMLDKSFHDYLEKQKTEKSRLEADASTVWEKYKYGKQLLNVRLAQKIPTVESLLPQEEQAASLPVNSVPDVSLEDIMKKYEELKQSGSKSFDFENPFRKFQKESIVDQILKRAGKKKSTYQRNEEQRHNLTGSDVRPELAKSCPANIEIDHNSNMSENSKGKNVLSNSEPNNV